MNIKRRALDALRDLPSLRKLDKLADQLDEEANRWRAKVAENSALADQASKELLPLAKAATLMFTTLHKTEYSDALVVEVVNTLMRNERQG